MKNQEIFTQAEWETIELVWAEKSNSQIADALNLSKGAIEDRLRRIYKKTGTKNRIALIKYLIKHGYFEP